MPELRQKRRDERGVARLRPLLEAGPWLWPDQASDELAYACEVTSGAGPPDAAGRALAVTVRESEGSATLWCLASPSDVEQVPLGKDPLTSWANACAALPRSLPVLWASLRPHRTPPPAIRLATHQGRPGISTPEALIDGPSLGLAFFLFLAARVSGVRVAEDAIASAAIDGAGALGPVDGLRLKIEAVATLAPRVRRLLVCEAQVEEARELAAGRLEVLGFASAAAAAEALHGEALTRKLIQMGQTPREREALVRSLLRMSLAERLHCWTPIRQAAGRALTTWVGLADDQLATLRFVEVVAARHEGVNLELAEPLAAWLDSLPRTLRLLVLANLVQHAHDTGSPADALALASVELSAEPRHASAPELRLHGAVARLQATTGAAAAALARQEQLARAHVETLNHGEVSWPLCEWLRLAAALGDGEAFARALAFREEAEAIEPFAPGDRCFLRLAAARGRVVLGEAQEEALAELTELSTSQDVPDHVRRSAARWRLAALRQRGTGVGEARAAFDEACGDGPGAMEFRALVSLDEALGAGDEAAARAALDELGHRSPALVERLRGAAPAGQLAAHVARFFPY